MRKRAGAVLPITLVLLLFPALSAAQDRCGLPQPLTIGQLGGRVLFDYNGALFAVKDAEVLLSYKGELAFEVTARTSTDADGRFRLEGVKPGKYYLTVQQGRLPNINLMEVNVSPGARRMTDGGVEFVIGSDERRECGGGYVRTVSTHGERLAGRSDVPESEGISEISLEHTGCFGSCPIEKIVLRKDGTVTYTGKDFVPYKGTRRGKMTHGFAHLAELVYRAGFFNLKDKYEAPYTDLDTSVISVVRNGSRKTVTNYGGEAPVEVWGIEKAIEALLREVEWEKAKSAARRRGGPR